MLMEGVLPAGGSFARRYRRVATITSTQYTIEPTSKVDRMAMRITIKRAGSPFQTRSDIFQQNRPPGHLLGDSRKGIYPHSRRPGADCPGRPAGGAVPLACRRRRSNNTQNWPKVARILRRQ